MHCKVLYVSNRQGGLSLAHINRRCNPIVLHEHTAQSLSYSLSTDCATPCYSLSTDSATLMLFLISRLCNTLLFLINRRRNTCVIPYQQTVKHLWYSLSTDVPSLVLFNRRCNSESRSSFLVNSVEINVPSVENSELTNVLPLKPGIGQNIATLALLTARNFFQVQMYTFLVHSPSLKKNPRPTF